MNNKAVKQLTKSKALMQSGYRSLVNFNKTQGDGLSGDMNITFTTGKNVFKKHPKTYASLQLPNTNRNQYI